MKNIFGVLALILLFNCSKDETQEAKDILVDSQLISEWIIESKGINNTPSIETYCCESITFLFDNNIQDLTGNFIQIIDSEEITGKFTVNPLINTISFSSPSVADFIYNYEIEQSDFLKLSYFENGAVYYMRYSRAN
ncbi:MAG: hypothetical protein NWQ07_08745 [Flaviramulus sp.]|nr:hypothetical protein [Flaviramulus sp.]